MSDQPNYPQPQYPYQQPPQDQPPMPPPAPKKRTRGKFFAIGCGALAALVVLIAVIAIAASAGGKSSNTQATPTSAPIAQATQAATQAPTHALKWTTTHTFTGNGTKKTAIFTAPDDWKLLWKCDPNSFYGGSYNVIVDVTGSDGSPVDPGAVNTICKAGNTGDSTEEHQGGQVYLDINSEGAWTITIQELK